VVEKYIVDKLREKLKYEEAKDEDIPECSLENRFGSPAQVAIYLKNFKTKAGAVSKRKRASRLLPVDFNEVIDYLKYKNTSDEICIEFRAGEKIKKCKDYCACNSFCDYFQREKKRRVPPTIHILVDVDNFEEMREKWKTFYNKVKKYL
ncbi:MAG: hypothetical protein OMM_06930, partial [Candidatus Magnetoglobus multicellularis str. Araruama]